MQTMKEAKKQIVQEGRRISDMKGPFQTETDKFVGFWEGIWYRRTPTLPLMFKVHK